MRLLFLGAIVGRAGRQVVFAGVPRLRDAWRLDFVVANGENAAGGFGITRPICQDLYEAGVDVITSGNHIWDQREIIEDIEMETRLLRPANYPAIQPGHGAGLFEGAGGQRVLVINLMGRLFMPQVDNPLPVLEDFLRRYRLGDDVDAILVDMHAEASSEKTALANICDGRVSVVVGTHTHVPTADARLLPQGTAFQTDAGMCGDYDSVIGMQKEESIYRLQTGLSSGRMSPAQGPATLCGLLVDISDDTGLADAVQPVRLGGCLQETRIVP